LESLLGKRAAVAEQTETGLTAHDDLSSYRWITLADS
jgi:hypothetical protein